MKHEHLNYIILHDNTGYYLFERLGKKVPFEAYNKDKAICFSENLETLFSENQGSPRSKSLGSSKIDFSENRKIPRYEIEEKPYEVTFND